MREMRYVDAVKEAHRIAMRLDPDVFVVGEDVRWGGPFGHTAKLVDEFGEMRMVDTPISETEIMGLSVGAAAMALKPVITIDFCDFLGVCMDEITNQMAKLHYMFGGQASLNMTLRTQIGVCNSTAAQHSQSLEAFMCHIPGLKVVAAATPDDAKGLLLTSIFDDNPVVFLEGKAITTIKGEVHEGDDYRIPFGKLKVMKEGKDVTILGWSSIVHECMAAAEKLEKDGISAEVIDIRSLIPLDVEGILNSVGKTGRLVIAHEAVKIGGYGAEIAAMVCEKGFDLLKKPIQRVGAPFCPTPFSPPLEALWAMSSDRIADVARSVM